MSVRPVDPHLLLMQATCSVFVKGDLKGTAWLFNEVGYLFTAGHIIKENEPFSNDDIQIQFSNDETAKAIVVESLYDHDNAVDFAILRILNDAINRFPLRISLSREFVHEDPIISYGFGKSLLGKTRDKKAPGTGKFIGFYDQLLMIDSEHLREEGYSGSPIFFTNKGAVVGLQIRARVNKPDEGKTHKDTILAMPLYRIAEILPAYKPLFYLETPHQRSSRLEDDIMEILYTEASKYPQKPAITIQELIHQIEKRDSYKYVRTSDKDFIVKLRQELFELEGNRKYINTIIDENGGIRECAISDTGIEYIKNHPPATLYQPNSTADNIQFPRDLNELLAEDPVCANQVRRYSEIEKIMNYFVKRNASSNKGIVSVYGHQNTGKTSMLETLQNSALQGFIPILTNLQNCDTSQIDYFLYEWADQIFYEFTRIKPFEELSPPSENLFAKGNGSTELFKYWKIIQDKANTTPIILIVDDIDALLNDVSTLDPKIIDFLAGFINSFPDVNFVLIGSEAIKRNENLKKLFDLGLPIDIGVFADGTAQRLALLLGRHLSMTQDAVNTILQFCDDHPLFVTKVFEKLIEVARQLPDKWLDQDMVRNYLQDLIGEIDLQLVAICKDLSKSEKTILWVWSQFPKEARQIYSISDLPELAQLAGSSEDKFNPVWKKGIEQLKLRRWIEPISAVEVKFRPGIMLDWMSRRYSSLEEAIRE